MRLISLPTWELRYPPVGKKNPSSDFQGHDRPLPRFEALGYPRTSARRQSKVLSTGYCIDIRVSEQVPVQDSPYILAGRQSQTRSCAEEREQNQSRSKPGERD